MKAAFSKKIMIGSSSVIILLCVVGLRNTLTPSYKHLPLSTLEKSSQPVWLEVIGETINYRFLLASGKWHSQAEDRGKCVLLFFCSTWAHPCESMLAGLNQYWQEHQKASLCIYGLFLEGDAKTIQEYQQTHPIWIPYTIISSELINRKELIHGVPTLYVLSRQGKLMKRIEGKLDPEELDEIVRPLLMP